jgi:hypothetical protein
LGLDDNEKSNNHTLFAIYILPIIEIIRIAKITTFKSYLGIISLVNNLLKSWQKSLGVSIKKNKDKRNVKI